MILIENLSPERPAIQDTCGYCVVMGQKVSIKRPRVRTTDDKELRLGSYEMFHRGEPLTETVIAPRPPSPGF